MGLFLKPGTRTGQLVKQNLKAAAIATATVIVTSSSTSRRRTVSEVGSKNVPGGNQQLFAQMCHLLRTHGQQSQHAFHHLSGVHVDALLVDADDIRQERQRLDLRRYEVDKHLLVERRVCSSTHKHIHTSTCYHTPIVA